MPALVAAWPEIVLVSALFSGTVAYLCLLPRVLGMSDEGLYLYEAKRLLEGQVLYRDVFDLITPGAHYVMAALFWVFGTDMATARVADAVMHGLIVVAVYAACRILGVHRGIATAAALSDPAIFRPAWAVASPHWFSTLISLVLLLTLLRTPRWGMLAGVVTGLVIAVQQQRGGMMVVGVVTLLATEYLLGRRVGVDGGLPAFGHRLAAFLAGVLLVLAPLCLVLVWTAGVEPVLRALVIHPLVNYRGKAAGASWGYVGPFGWLARYTVPRLLPWEPVLTALVGCRAGVELRWGHDRERGRRSVVLAVMSAAWAGSILYFPDFIHLCIIGPVFAIIAADLLESGLAAVGTWWGGAHPVRWLATTALLLALGVHLGRVFVGSWRDFPLARTTPFGRVDFREQREVDLVEDVRAKLEQAGTTELFVYPAGAALYLLTGAINPTPFQFMAPGYSRPDQLDQAVETLERRKVLYVLMLVELPGDPVTEYVRRRYTAPPGSDRSFLRQRVEDAPG
jgi:hypothetical protein